MRPEQEHSELTLAAAIAHVLGVHVERRDRREGRRIRDFDLCGFPDRPDEPLEVTWHANPAVIQTGHRLLGAATDAPMLSRTWLVSVPNEVNGAAFDRHRFEREVPPLLAELETEGLEEFDVRLWFKEPALKPTLIALAQAGCQFGRSYPAKDGAAKLHPLWGGGGMVGRDIVAEAVEAECKPDNVEKLRQLPDAQRRHLAVFVHTSQALVFNATNSGELGRLPNLPEPITTAWVLGAGTRLYTSTSPESWETHEVPMAVFERPELWLEPTGSGQAALG